jgi:hypothetical protein
MCGDVCGVYNFAFIHIRSARGHTLKLECRVYRACQPRFRVTFIVKSLSPDSYRIARVPFGPTTRALLLLDYDLDLNQSIELGLYRVIGLGF